MLQRIEYNQNPTIAALARSTKQAPAFLNDLHIEAVLRLTRLYSKARIQQAITQAYAQRVDYGGGGGSDLGELALDARKTLAEVHANMSADCISVVMDVCCFEKSLSDIETERQWPRRSAKMVLRIGLEQAAQQLNQGTIATMRKDTEPERYWREDGARPTDFY